jgi:hypothetical protein
MNIPDIPKGAVATFNLIVEILIYFVIAVGLMVFFLLLLSAMGFQLPVMA